MKLADRFGLAGRQALVIGGGTGIGRAIAVGLAEAGADVHLAGRRTDVLEGACGQLRALGRASRAFPVDGTDMDALRAFVAEVSVAVGAPDILVNAQGVMQLAAAEDYEPQDYDRVMDTNAKGVWFASSWFGRAMLARGSGCIISIASLACSRSGSARSSAIPSPCRSIAASQFSGLRCRTVAIPPRLPCAPGPMPQ